MIKVLYVDDEPDIREIARLSLELDGGLDVRECGSGAEAIAVAREWRPEIILLDVMMPGLDGPATFAALREQAETTATPVVFITAKVQAGDADRLLASGASGVLAKPFDPMTLADDVRGFLS